MSPELLGPSDLVDEQDWRGLTQDVGLTKFWVWMSLVDMEVQSAQMSFHDYLAARDSPAPYGTRIVNARMLHSARSFVCAVRRFARLLEDFAGLSESRGDFPTGTTNVVKTAWMKQRAFLNGYTGLRNVIEHVSGEIRGKERWFFLYWAKDRKDTLVSEVDRDGQGQEVSAEITTDAMRRVLKARAEIVDGIHKLAETNGKA